MDYHPDSPVLLLRMRKQRVRLRQQWLRLREQRLWLRQRLRLLSIAQQKKAGLEKVPPFVVRKNPIHRR